MRCLVAVFVTIGIALTSGVAGATIVHVSVDPASSSIQIGQLTTLSVKASLESPAAGDGIFTYDLNLMLANMLGGSSMPVAVVGVHRPGVDDADFGGSDGTTSPTGVLGIYGGYFDNTVGIGSPATLFTVDVRGVSAGQASISPGPSVVPYGVDVLLYESTSATVSYEAGATIAVVVPEPGEASVLIMIGSYGLLAARGIRRRRTIAHTKA